jgi:geranylgeranyl pyrophosphate synthase
MALIHDDIMDQSEKRHNAMTLHTYVETLLGTNINKHHVGESQAILIGDLILCRVYELRYKIK